MKISSDARDVLRGTVAYYHQTSDPSSQPARYADPLAVTSSLDHASQFSTTEGEGWNHLIAEYRHRWPESREGRLERHNSILLTMIRVRFHLFCDGISHVHTYPGLDD